MEWSLSGEENALQHLQSMMLAEPKYWLAHLLKTCPYRSSKDPLPSNSCSDYTKNCTNGWRITMTQWYFSVADNFDFDRGVVSIALNYLDRVVLQNQDTRIFTTNEQLQLTAVTCLYLAMKLHGEIEHPPAQRQKKYERKKLTLQAFVVLSKRQFDADAIQAFELQLLSMLDWQLNPPDARSYVACMLELMPSHLTYICEWRCIYDIARYICELSLGESDLLFDVSPSVVALASILCAINSLGRASKSLPSLQVLEAWSRALRQATSLGFDSDSVTQTAIRLTHLCPSIFANDNDSSKRCDDEAGFEAVSIEEICNSVKDPPATTPSPVCVGTPFSEDGFFVKTSWR